MAVIQHASKYSNRACGGLRPARHAGAIALLLCAGSAAGCASQAPAAGTVPANTVIYLRLNAPVSSATSKKGQPVTATVAREVVVPGGVAIPIGAILTGEVRNCVVPATPQEHAELLLAFTRLELPGQRPQKVSGRVSGVTNARESVLADGTIQGVLQADAPAALLSGALAKLGAVSPEIAQQIQKEKIGAVNTAIEYAAGTDIQFTLAEPLNVGQLWPSVAPVALADDLRTSIKTLLAEAPQRSVSKDNRPGDPLNLIFIGSAQDIEAAFQKAGWVEAKAKNGQSIWDTARAVMNNDGYSAAPVSDLYVFGRKEDLAFEKTLNTFNKRHHLRLWQSPERAPDGRPIWLGAATHDTGIDIHPGVVSHATDPELDDERAQVEADLVSGGAVAAIDLVTPPSPLSQGSTATGGAWHTDGRLLAVDVKPAAAGSRSR